MRAVSAIFLLPAVLANALLVTPGHDKDSLWFKLGDGEPARLLERHHGLYRDERALDTFRWHDGVNWVVYSEYQGRGTAVVGDASTGVVREFSEGSPGRDLVESEPGGCVALLPPKLAPVDLAGAAATSSSGGDVLMGYEGFGEPVVEEPGFFRRVLETDYVFHPGCFDMDREPHDVDVGLVVDMAYVNKHGGSIEATRASVEGSLVTLSTLYEIQFNVRLKLAHLIIGGDSEDLMARGNGQVACTLDASVILRELVTLVAQGDGTLAPDVAHWHVLSGCRSGTSYSGVAYVGTMCSPEPRWATGVSIAGSSAGAWRVLAHELGHAFGAGHSFESGVGTTGGIMDYGDGRILNENVYRFRAPRGEEMCSVLSSLKANRCPYFRQSGGTAQCGDGILDATEQCECEDRSTSCRGCAGCQVLNPLQDCSTEKFYMHVDPQDPRSTDTLVYADPLCCVRGVSQSVSVQCNGGVCSTGGKCIDPCNIGVSYCGFCDRSSSSGCRAMCSYTPGESGDVRRLAAAPADPLCSSSFVDPNQNNLGNLPVGAKCEVSGTRGTCDGNGACLESNSGTVLQASDDVCPLNPTAPPSATTQTNDSDDSSFYLKLYIGGGSATMAVLVTSLLCFCKKRNYI